MLVMNKEYDLLIVTSYYFPYTSGISKTAQVLAETILKSGLKVCVLCYGHQRNVPEFECLNGVDVYRSSASVRINRGSFSFSHFLKFFQLSRHSKYVNLHTPLPEAALFALLSNKKLILNYHCELPRNTFSNLLMSFAIDISSKIAMLRASKVIFSTADYYDNSRLRNFAKTKLVIIPPFCQKRELVDPVFRDGNGTHFGFLGRFTSEKGALFLIDTFRNFAGPLDRLLVAGSSKVAGDSVFGNILHEAENDHRIRVIPDIDEEDLSGFYSSLNVFCFPSLNSFEAFGIAQVEAMFLDIPVLTANLPGVRKPVEVTGLGQVLPVGDKQAWGEAIANFNRSNYCEAMSSDAQKLFSNEQSTREYLNLFQE
jgi:glycosyltransferase involved in cell wall biosynthesis